MYESKSEPLLPLSKFLIRVGYHAAFSFGIILFSLALGVAGYHFLESLPWIDSLLNAAMILGGMGPVDQLHTDAGKLFASIYAIYSGVIFLGIVGILFAPIYHRFLHSFHLETDEDPQF